VSKYQFHESDIYLPGTDIPKNRANITDPAVLQYVEAELLTQAYQTFIQELQPSTAFNQAYFQALHQRTFESLYQWAGVYRSHDMSKGGSMFCRAAYLANESNRIFTALAAEQYLKKAAQSSREAFAERLAYYQSEIIALHPFYELNGRITRLFFDLIAIANGYNPIDYSHALNQNQEPNAYIQASIHCVQRADHSMLKDIILQGLSKAEAA
jgi:cell filamentation protein